MKMKNVSLLASATGSLLLASSAQAVITGVTVVPVSFESGWVNAQGGLQSSGTSTTAISNDAVQNARTAAAWAASGATGRGYKVFRVYITTDNAGTPVNGSAGDDVAGIDFRVQSLNKDGISPGLGFFNYMTGTANQASTAGPQAYGSAANNAQGQRAYDSYLTVGGADAGSNAGAAIEGAAGMFNAVRGRTGAAAAVQTNATGNSFDAANSINCQNCGFLATLPIGSTPYSYTSAASLAANFGMPITGIGVMVAQITVRNTDGIFGQLLAVGTGTSATAQWTFSYAANVPAPGALALLGLAGIAARRRRRA